MSLQKIQDADVLAHLAKAHGDLATFEVNGVEITFKLVRDSTGAYVVLSAEGQELPTLRLWQAKADVLKAAVRAETKDLVADYIAKGGKITTAEERAGSGLSARDWARKQQGLKVATKEEIEAERNRRGLLAITAKNAELVMQLLTGKFDREIKFDIEEGRLGPNGEIR